MDPKQMADLAKKAAKGGGAPGAGASNKGAPPMKKPEHRELDGDEGPDAPYSDDDGDEEGGGDESSQFGGHTDSEVASELADLVEKGIVSPVVKSALEGYDDSDGKPDWADEALWNRAVNAVQPNGSGKDEYEDPWLIVGVCYQLFGGEVPQEEGAESGEDASGDEGDDEDEDDDFGDDEDDSI